MVRYSLALMAALLAAFAAGPSVAQSHVNPIHLDVWLSQDHIALGEPIVLNYRLSNASAQPVRLGLGEDQVSWLHLSLADRTGKIVTPVPDRSPRLVNRTVLGPVQGLGPGVSSEDQVVVTRYFQPHSPGTYRVSVAVDAPIWPSGSAQPVPLRVHESVTVTVAASSQTALRRTLDSLVKAAVAHNGKVSWLAVQELMTMPESYALPVARALILPSHPDDTIRRQLKQELERIGSPAALSVLREANIQEQPYRNAQLRSAPFSQPGAGR